MLTMLKKIGFVIGAIFKTILIALLIMVIAPVPYFAWRMSQPLRYKEFNGLTYYQYQDWVSMEYQINENSGKFKKSECETQDILFNRILNLTLLPVGAFMPTAAGLFGVKPNPAKGIDAIPDDYYVHANRNSMNSWHSIVPVDVTFWNFLPKWWNIYEEAFWYSNGPVSISEYGCPIRAHVPTPAEYQAMKQTAQQASVVK
jgi:hypothetical protein